MHAAVMDQLNDSYDVAVIGGGAAGLAGAVALLRSRRSVLLVDAGDPRNAPAGHVHNFLTQDGTAPDVLYAAGARRYWPTVARSCTVTSTPSNGRVNCSGSRSRAGR